MKASVELTEGVSFQRADTGRVLVRGKPQVLTDPSELDYYLSNSRFRVTWLEPAKIERTAGRSAPAVRGGQPESPVALSADDLRQRRLTAGLSQAAVASGCGVSQRLISAWERGEKAVSTARLARLLAVLGQHPTG